MRHTLTHLEPINYKCKKTTDIEDYIMQQAKHEYAIIVSTYKSGREEQKAFKLLKNNIMPSACNDYLNKMRAFPTVTAVRIDYA